MVQFLPPFDVAAYHARKEKDNGSKPRKRPPAILTDQPETSFSGNNGVDTNDEFPLIDTLLVSPVTVLDLTEAESIPQQPAETGGDIQGIVVFLFRLAIS
jgi:hypothetical protein